MRKLVQTKHLLLTAILLFPLYQVRFSVFGIPTNVAEAWVIAIFGWWFSGVPLSVFLHAFRKWRGLFIGAVLIGGGLLLSTVAGGDVLKGLGIIKSWFIVPCLLAVMIVGNSLQEKSNRKIEEQLLIGFFVSAAAVAAVSLIMATFGKGITYDTRLAGLYPSANYLAMYLTPAVFVGAGLLLKREISHRGRIFLAGGMLFIFGALALSRSYANLAAALLVLIAGALWFLWRGYFKENQAGLTKKGLIVGTVLIAVLSGVLFFEKGSTKFQDLISLDERSSAVSRMMVWRSALAIGRDHWLAGIGPGNFQNQYLQYQKHFPPYLEWAVLHPHNLWLTFWLYSGLLGVAGLLIFLVFWARAVWHSVKSGNTAALISVGIIAYILLYGLVDTPYWKNDLAFVFWLAASTGLLPTLRKNE